MDEEYHQQQAGPSKKAGKQHNTLPIWGNEATMNLNPLILANIQGSSYFKIQLFKLKTYHEVVDEIYYQVKHMEPWERGSRKTSGQTGMCGGVRGVGAGGIVSTAYCLLYKLYTLKLTRKQMNGLLNHTDSPYIRALGFMYLRYTQPPADLYDWYEDYLQDEEEIDIKAGGGQTMTMGQVVYSFLTKLEWCATLFPRIPVPIQKQIEKKIELYCREHRISINQLNCPRSALAASSAAAASANAAAAAAAAAGGGGSGFRGGVAYEEEDYERPTSHRSTRLQYAQSSTSRAAVGSTYRTEHDDRGFYPDDVANDSRYRRRDVSRSPNGRDSERERDRPRQKHKKKGKHKHRSRSRSRSESRSRSRRRHERKEREYERDRDNTREKYENRERRY